MQGAVIIFCSGALSNAPVEILDALKMCSIEIILCHLVYNFSGETPELTAWDGPMRNLRAIVCSTAGSKSDHLFTERKSLWIVGSSCLPLL